MIDGVLQALNREIAEQFLDEKAVRYRKTIAQIEKAAKALPCALGEDPFPLEHSFADGLYIRKIFIPAGVFVVGKYHPHSFVSFIERGDMSILTEDGVKRVTGAQMQVSPAGTKRFGYAHLDTVWVTVHSNPANERNLEALEMMIHAPDVFELEMDEPIKLHERFDSRRFVELTEIVFAAEKVGFYSDWTVEQQDAFDSGDWEKFSRARGYSEKEIAELSEWVKLKEYGEGLGFNPLILVKDIVFGYAVRNMMMDINKETISSSCIPVSKKESV